MALTFGAASSNRVDCGSAAGIDELLTMTVLALVRPTALTSGRVIVAKKFDTNATAGWRLALQGTTGQLNFNRRHTSNATSYTSTDNLCAPVDTWRWVAATYDEAGGAGARVNLYGAAIHEMLAETGTYATSTNGTGASLADEAQSLIWSNYTDNPSASFQGQMAFGMIVNRVLTLGELWSLQFNPRPISGCVNFMRFGWNGTSTQADMSGSGNAGTVTGASVATAWAPIPALALGGSTIMRIGGEAAVPYVFVDNGAYGGYEQYNGGYG